MFQPLRQYLPVACRLVEHIDEVAVFQDVFDFRGGKQVLGVLGRPGGDAAPFSEPFQISALYAAVCSSFRRRWNSSTKYQVERPIARLMVTVFHTASWTMSIPGFLGSCPGP